MNVELLQEIKARILAEPDSFRMDQWSCGTAHCIAGWACALVGNPVVPRKGSPSDSNEYYDTTADGRRVSAVACEVLDIEASTSEPDDWEASDLSESDRLFLVESWPDRFERAYYQVDAAEIEGDVPAGEARRQRALIAADRIDHFIATNGNE